MATPTPVRPAEQVVGSFIPITLGGKEFRLRELPRRANRGWQEHLTAEVRKALSDSKPVDTADEVIEAIAASAELMMDLLLAYDAACVAWPGSEPVLPDREWIDTTATDRECYEAIKKVTGIAFPPGADLLRLLPELRPWLLESVSRGVATATERILSRSTSSAPPSTTGGRSTSRRASRTRNSSATSTGPSSAATA